MTDIELEVTFIFNIKRIVKDDIIGYKLPDYDCKKIAVRIYIIAS